jgi:hypothetical protein
MNDPKKDISKLQDEMDRASEDAAKSRKGEASMPVLHKAKNLSFDAVLTGAGMLVVLGLSVSLASQLTRDQVTALTAGSIGASGGLAIGYGIGRRRNG